MSFFLFSVKNRNASLASLHPLFIPSSLLTNFSKELGGFASAPAPPSHLTPAASCPQHSWTQLSTKWAAAPEPTIPRGHLPGFTDSAFIPVPPSSQELNPVPSGRLRWPPNKVTPPMGGTHCSSVLPNSCQLSLLQFHICVIICPD